MTSQDTYTISHKKFLIWPKLFMEVVNEWRNMFFISYGTIPIENTSIITSHFLRMLEATKWVSPQFGSLNKSKNTSPHFYWFPSRSLKIHVLTFTDLQIEAWKYTSSLFLIFKQKFWNWKHKFIFFRISSEFLRVWIIGRKPRISSTL